VRVNGERVEGFSGTLAELLEIRGVRREGVAVAIDGEVVPRSQWATTPVAPQAQVEIVTAAAGG
jgi:sulfur carrier protein